MLRLFFLVSAWLLWSGRYTLESPLIATFGAGSCLAVLLLSYRMKRFAPTGIGRSLGWRTLLYPFWLALEVVKSNLQVTRIVLDPRLPISPRVIRVAATQRGEAARVLFANSITLTPGTISMQVERDHIEVHALTREIADDLASGAMNEKVSHLERQS